MDTGVSTNDIHNLKSSIKQSRNSKLSLKAPSFGNTQKESIINQTLGFEADSKVSAKFTTSRANSTAFGNSLLLDQTSIDVSRISQVKPEIKQIQSLLK